MLLIPILAFENPLEHVLAHRMNWRLGPFDITNQMLMALVAAVLMLLIFPALFAKARSDAPRGARNFFESILEFLRVEVFRPALKEHTDRFVPFLWTLFFFILFCNLLGQIPFGDIYFLCTGKATHFGGTATGSMTVTGALAVCAFIFIHLNGIVQVARSLRDGTYGHHAHHEEHSSDGSSTHEAAHDLEHVRGEALPADVPGDMRAIGNPTKHYADDQSVSHASHGSETSSTHGHGASVGTALLWCVPLYLWNFAPHPFKPGPNDPKIGWLIDVPMRAMLHFLEMIGAVIKPFALMVRLFANMIAGHIVLAALIGLILLVPSAIGRVGVGIPVVLLSLLIRFLELFVAFLQAYIFVFLTTLFIASAVAPEH